MNAAFLPQKTRDKGFDLLRAFAIYGVVWIHAPFAGRENLAISPLTLSAILEAAFRWAVPVFLILSAYFSARSLQKRPETTREFLSRRLPPLFAAFAIYSLIYWLLSADFRSRPLKFSPAILPGAAGWVSIFSTFALLSLAGAAKNRCCGGYFFGRATIALYVFVGKSAPSFPILAKIIVWRFLLAGFSDLRRFFEPERSVFWEVERAAAVFGPLNFAFGTVNYSALRLDFPRSARRFAIFEAVRPSDRAFGDGGGAWRFQKFKRHVLANFGARRRKFVGDFLPESTAVVGIKNRVGATKFA